MTLPRLLNLIQETHLTLNNVIRNVKKQLTIRAMLFWVESEMPQDPPVFRFLGEMSSAWVHSLMP